MNEETFLTTALFDSNNKYICDLLGEENHIRRQMKNIAIIVYRLNTALIITKTEGVFELRFKGDDKIRFEAVIQ